MPAGVALDRAREDHAPNVQLAVDAGGRPMVRLSGSWRLTYLSDIHRLLAAQAPPAGAFIDGSGVHYIDSAGALALVSWLGATADPAKVPLEGFADNERRIVEQVRERLQEFGTPAPVHVHSTLAKIGRSATDIWLLISGHLNFLGLTLVGIFTSALNPRTLRLRELTAQLEQVCLNAIPVVALVTCLIGVVVAYLLGLQAEQYGANIFVVDGVGIGATREFAPIIVAVIVAGRSGAAFTAQLGSMRLTEETDAIQTLGLSPLAVLVLPRVLALMLAMPLLVFVGDVMSLFGAMLIAGPMLDITPTSFLARLHENLDIKHVYAGLIKAPVFALAIAVIGCRMGMTVERDTRALGLATTSTVVQGIVVVILLDAAFAVLFQEMGI